MQKSLLLIVCLLSAICASAASSSVTVTSPANGSTVPGPVSFVASATSSCSEGVASMGIYTAPGVLAYVANGSSLNTSLSLSAGTYNTTVEEWDYCGGASTKAVTVTVSSGQSGVTITAPTNNGNPGSPVNFVASASSTCSKGVASMGIYTAPYQLAYVGNGSSLNTNLTLSTGTYNATVTEWDNCGGSSSTPVTFTVGSGGGGGSGSGGSSFTELQHSGGWDEYGQIAPTYVDCSPSPCDGITFSMEQNIKSPSMSGEATEYNLGSDKDIAYGDGLWNNHLIGSQSSQGMPDSGHDEVNTYHNFTYDVYFYGSNLGLSQALEFDVNQFFDSMGFIFGHECRIAAGNEWDVWDNATSKWIPTGIACNPIDNEWNHLTIKVERTTDNQLTYQSIELNGVTSTLNWTYGHGSAPSSWWGITINYQMDGNDKQSPYSVYLDELTFTYQ
jgi:major membrane immunogen (membrane-anchored lipoprotein)